MITDNELFEESSDGVIGEDDLITTENHSGISDNNGVKLKSKLKDSVFTHLFRDKTYVYQLYKDLVVDDNTTTIDDIEITTLRAMFLNTIYNDLSFIVKGKEYDRYMVFVEAQSSWNYNMTLRLFMYYFEVLRRRLDMDEISYAGNSKVHIPMPEMFVIYTGDKKNIPEYESFNDVYFNGKASVDLVIKILSEENTTIYGQYIKFCKVYNEKYKKFGKTFKTILETIRECKDKGCLVSFLSNHEKEVTSIMDGFFSESGMLNQFAKENIAKGRAEGLAKGRAEGLAKGRAEGLVEGEAIGTKNAIRSLIQTGTVSLEKFM